MQWPQNSKVRRFMAAKQKRWTRRSCRSDALKILASPFQSIVSQIRIRPPEFSERTWRAVGPIWRTRPGRFVAIFHWPRADQLRHTAKWQTAVRRNSFRKNRNLLATRERTFSRVLHSRNDGRRLRVSGLRQRRVDGYLPRQQRQMRFL